MRPRGEVREALAKALEQLHQVQGAVSARELASATQVGFEKARETLKDMARSGEIDVAGKSKNAGETAWCNLYEPKSATADQVPLAWGGIEALADVMHGFVAPLLPTD